MATYRYLVITKPVPGQEDEYNRWYTERHLPDVVAVPGMVAAQRFRVTGESNLPGSYLAIYELETNDPAAVLAEVNARAGTDAMPLSPALDLANVTVALLEPITGRVVK